MRCQWKIASNTNAAEVIGATFYLMLIKILGIQQENTMNSRREATACYVQVSSYEKMQKGDFDRQKARVLEHCVNHKYNVEHIFSGSWFWNVR